MKVLAEIVNGQKVGNIPAFGIQPTLDPKGGLSEKAAGLAMTNPLVVKDVSQSVTEFIPKATDSQFGLVKPSDDGSIVVDNGLISAVQQKMRTYAPRTETIMDASGNVKNNIGAEYSQLIHDNVLSGKLVVSAWSVGPTGYIVPFIHLESANFHFFCIYRSAGDMASCSFDYDSTEKIYKINTSISFSTLTQTLSLRRVVVYN